MAVILDSGITMEVLKRTRSAYSLSRLHSGSVRSFLARIRPVLASRCSQEGLATRIWFGAVLSCQFFAARTDDVASLPPPPLRVDLHAGLPSSRRTTASIFQQNFCFRRELILKPKLRVWAATTWQADASLFDILAYRL
jgi:hypothetical protein